MTQNKTGDMQNAYSPLKNLVTKYGLSNFTTENLKFNRYCPQDMLITDEYDGSVNIILNDDYNQPRLINTRIAIQENNTFLTPEHNGNATTNVYEDAYFNNQSGLFKLYQTIPDLTFKGLGRGALSCGSYTFYFKLSDADNNLTNIIQHSKIIQVHVGETGTYKVRMGLENENAGKSVRFKLSNLDGGFDYVRVFYERTTSAADLAKVTEYYMVDQNFPIVGGICEFDITGNEKSVKISLDNITSEYADIATAKTQTVNQNILFLGNVSGYVHDYQALQQLAWQIYPTFESGVNVKTDVNYIDSTDNSYYNVNNVYDYVGYWPDEYYRFGVVFIYDNNQLSPVFNVLGYDTQLLGEDEITELWNISPTSLKSNPIYEKWDSESTDYIFKRQYMVNSRGVVRTPKNGSTAALGVKFHYDQVKYFWRQSTSSDKSIQDILKNYGIKGLFYVRQKRVPTILAQGLVIGLTGKDYGSLPILQADNYWVTKSFLNSDRMLSVNGSDVTTSQATAQALLIPDAELQEATFNHIFTSQEFCLQKVRSLELRKVKDLFYCNGSTNDADVNTHISKLTAVPKLTQSLTDGVNYFSSVAGIPDQSYKTEDVCLKWNDTYPQLLTKSTSVVRGEWGYYVGMSYSGFQYGDVVNIKIKGFATDPTTQNLLEFQNRFSNYNLYSPISTRYNIKQITEKLEYGGDCFYSTFTHKMMNNFADPDLPTNTKIVDPKCWAKNYAVRSTAYIASKNGLLFNAAKNNEGWYLTSGDVGTPKDEDTPKFYNELAEVFEIDVMPYEDSITVTDENKTLLDEAKTSLGKSTETVDYQLFSEDVLVGETATRNQSGDRKFWLKEMFGSIVPFGISFWLSYINYQKYKTGVTEKQAFGLIYKVAPEPVQTGLGLVDAFIRFKNASRHNYVRRGLTNINRSDVNAVSFGQWITFPIQSSMNLAFRDIDFQQVMEEASFNQKRSFYPLEEMNAKVHIPDSNCANYAIKKSICTNQQKAYLTVPFVKQEYFNRIYWSKPNVTQNFINSYRLIFKEQYQEYSKEYGSITKILPYGNDLIIVFQHGIGAVEINRSPQSEYEKSPYLASKSVLPSNLSVLTADYGSMWKDSVIQTPSGMIYGIDTVAKKIWALAGTKLTFISDQLVGKFLNKFITLSEFDTNEYVGHINVVTHYNEFKHDIIFTFIKDKPTYEISADTKKALIAEVTTELKKLGFTNNYYSTWSQNDEKPIFSLNVYDTTNREDNTAPLVTYQYVIRSGRIFYNNLDTGYTAEVKEWEEGVVWSLCYNERLGKFMTFYDWYPVLSANINNIFFTFNQEDLDTVYDNATNDNAIALWKHGQGGLFDNQETIKPTHWYGKQHEFNFEFVINADPARQKIFNNLKILSNKAAPGKFEYEVVGEGYDWFEYKPVVLWINKKTEEDPRDSSGLKVNKDQSDSDYWWKYVLGKTSHDIQQAGYTDFPDVYEQEAYGATYRRFTKLPYLKLRLTDKKGTPERPVYSWDDTEPKSYWEGLKPHPDNKFQFNCSEVCLTQDDQLNEQRVHSESLGNDIKRYGRVRGNMEYLEDLWDVEIRPIYFKWVYLQDTNVLGFKEVETRHRDKYLKVKVRYSGEDLAIISAISTMYNISYA